MGLARAAMRRGLQIVQLFQFPIADCQVSIESYEWPGTNRQLAMENWKLSLVTIGTWFLPIPGLELRHGQQNAFSVQCL
jgi:hypothetical protein